MKKKCFGPIILQNPEALESILTLKELIDADENLHSASLIFIFYENKKHDLVSLRVANLASLSKV
jgi:hypothetical protein